MLVDAGSFTKGARAMHISQPALSAAIKKLERELQSELLRYNNRQLRPTVAGQLAYDAGKELIAKHTDLKQRLAELSQSKVPLRLGMIDSLAETLFVYGLELNALELWARVSLSINNSSLLLQAVLNHELDVAIIAEQSALPKTITKTSLGAEPLMLVARSDVASRFQQVRKTGTLPDFLSYDQASTTHGLLQAAARRHGVELQPSFYSTSPDIILKLVLSGRGAAALPYLMVKTHYENGVLEPIRLGNSAVIERRIAAIVHSSRTLPVAFEDTLSRTKNQLQTLLQEAKAM